MEFYTEKTYWPFNGGNGLYIPEKGSCKIVKVNWAKEISSHHLYQTSWRRIQLLFVSFTTGDCHDVMCHFAITVSFFHSVFRRNFRK